MPTKGPAAAKKDAEMGVVVAAGEHAAADAVWAMLLGYPGMLGMELSGTKGCTICSGILFQRKGVCYCASMLLLCSTLSMVPSAAAGPGRHSTGF